MVDRLRAKQISVLEVLVLFLSPFGWGHSVNAACLSNLVCLMFILLLLYCTRVVYLVKLYIFACSALRQRGGYVLVSAC